MDDPKYSGDILHIFGCRGNLFCRCSVGGRCSCSHTRAIGGAVDTLIHLGIPNAHSRRRLLSWLRWEGSRYVSLGPRGYADLLFNLFETTTCLRYDVGLDGCVSHARGDSGCFILSEYEVRRICRRFRRAVRAAADVNERLRLLLCMVRVYRLPLPVVSVRR